MGAYTPIGLLLGERYIDDPEGLDSFYPKSLGKSKKHRQANLYDGIDLLDAAMQAGDPTKEQYDRVKDLLEHGFQSDL